MHKKTWKKLKENNRSSVRVWYLPVLLMWLCWALTVKDHLLTDWASHAWSTAEQSQAITLVLLCAELSIKAAFIMLACEVMREHHLREMAPQMAGQLCVTACEDTARQQKSNKAAHTGSLPAEDKLFLLHCLRNCKSRISLCRQGNETLKDPYFISVPPLITKQVKSLYNCCEDINMLNPQRNTHSPYLSQYLFNRWPILTYSIQTYEPENLWTCKIITFQLKNIPSASCLECASPAPSVAPPWSACPSLVSNVSTRSAPRCEGHATRTGRSWPCAGCASSPCRLPQTLAPSPSVSGAPGAWTWGPPSGWCPVRQSAPRCGLRARCGGSGSLRTETENWGGSAPHLACCWWGNCAMEGQGNLTQESWAKFGKKQLISTVIATTTKTQRHQNTQSICCCKDTSPGSPPPGIWLAELPVSSL